jgi:hypothetical protein
MMLTGVALIVTTLSTGSVSVLWRRAVAEADASHTACPQHGT